MAETKETHEEHDTSTENADDSNHDPQFEPIVSLPEQEIKTLEEDEEELFKMRAKLFRFASENDLPEWKERGTGDVKLLKHREKGTIRLLMRRDKTLKICANHYITPLMELKPNAGSDRAWVWNTHADFADESPKPELLAIRFLNAENAQKFKAKFEECRNEVDKGAKKGYLQFSLADHYIYCFLEGYSATEFWMVEFIILLAQLHWYDDRLWQTVVEKDIL
ncbi:Ran-specific GTPase-activating protein [Chelonia mydas]|uniref:Ran-specific GTPase-activating protein n=1 Tax=Chelonia mydas TaxID=8469 RepID=M7BSW6_CHEMY|nr:Ran-specific GTPase-activating protein [Chelonia mydas]